RRAKQAQMQMLKITITPSSTTASLTMTSALNVVIDNPLAVIADAVSSHSNSNKSLVVAPKRRSYRNHNVRQLVASQVTRSVRKRRLPAKLIEKQEDIANNSTSANDNT
ncbi:hypothetical protein DOY81_011881, partial [Sarcophaga bullata]